MPLNTSILKECCIYNTELTNSFIRFTKASLLPKKLPHKLNGKLWSKFNKKPLSIIFNDL